MKLIEKILEIRKEEHIVVSISNVTGFVWSEGPVVRITLSYSEFDGTLLTDEVRASVTCSEELIIKIIDERVEFLKKHIDEHFKERILQELEGLKEECKDLIVEVTDEDSD